MKPTDYDFLDVISWALKHPLIGLVIKVVGFFLTWYFIFYVQGIL